MTITAGTPTTSGATTTTSIAAVPLALTGNGDLNFLSVSANSTGTGIQPTLQLPSGWAWVGGTTVWKSGSPSHELGIMYRVRQAGDPTSIPISWTNTGNAEVLPFGLTAGSFDSATPIVSGEYSLSNSAGPTTVVSGALTLGGARYVFGFFGNRSNATWSAAGDTNIHDSILLQGIAASAANGAITSSGATTTSNGGARSLLSSASTSVQNSILFAVKPAASGGSGASPIVRTQAVNSGNSTTPTLTVPTGTLTGDTILLSLTQGNTDVLTAAPSTAYLDHSNANSGGTFVDKIYLIPVDGTTVAAGTVLSWTLSATRQWSINALVVQNTLAKSAILSHDESNANVSNVVMPSSTTAATSFILEHAVAKSNGTAITDFTAPGGWTKQSVQPATTTFGGASVWAVATTEPAVAGTYGGETWTPNQTGGSYLGHVIALVNRPYASFTNTPSSLSVSVAATASAVSPATIASYDWNWGDSTTHGTGASSSHTYAAGGTYTVTLTVTDSNGATYSTASSVTVTAPATTGFFIWNGTTWRPATPYLWNGTAWKIVGAGS